MRIFTLVMATGIVTQFSTIAHAQEQEDEAELGTGFVQTQTQQMEQDEQQQRFFLEGVWKAWWGEEAIITYNLPPNFRSRMAFNSYSGPQAKPRRLELHDRLKGTRVRFSPGSTLIYDMQTAVIRVSQQGESVSGQWASVPERENPIPFKATQSNVNPDNQNTSEILRIDEPAYLVITFKLSNIPVPCAGFPAYIRVDGQRIEDENGAPQPIYPGNSILAFGSSVDFAPSSTCNVPGGDPTYQVSLKIAEKSDVDASLGI